MIFFDSQFAEKWDGVAQQVHLICEYTNDVSWEIEPYKQAQNQEDDSDQYEKILIRKQGVQYGLNCVIATRFHQDIENSVQQRNFVYKKVKQIVEKLRESSQLDVEWIACNSLGAEDIVWIVLSDTIKDFAVFIEILRKLSFKTVDGEDKKNIFSAISSFAGFNREKPCGNPGADLIVRLNLRTFQDRAEGEEKLKKLKHSKLNHSTCYHSSLECIRME